MIRAGDDELSVGNIDTMGEGFVRQIAIDKARHHADFTQTIPDSDVFGAVFHKERDRIARFEALRRAPVCDLIGQDVHLSIGGQFTIMAKQDISRILIDHRFNVIWYEIG